MILHVFNPENDYALGNDSGFYTPPAKVLGISSNGAFSMSFFAEENDAILLRSDEEKKNIEKNGMQESFNNLVLLTPSDLGSYHNDIIKINPWGWNRSLLRLLSEGGIKNYILPNENFIYNLRKTAHRRTTISFLKSFKQIMPEAVRDLPQELISIEEVRNFLNTDSKYFFKEPWSSSGRGVIYSGSLTYDQILEWTWGSIRRQGSVILENAYNKTHDIASEWWCIDGNADFLGLSWFKTDIKGRYQENFILSQSEIKEKIDSITTTDLSHILRVQKKVIEKLIAPVYSGPLGIDMLIDKEGYIQPCIEINLRYTMGHVSLVKSKHILPEILRDYILKTQYRTYKR